MGYHWIRLVKQAPNLQPDQVRGLPRWHQAPKPGGSPHLRYWSYSNIKCQMSKWAQYELMGYQSIGLIKERPNLTISGHYLYTNVQCAISQIFQHGWIIPDFLAFYVCTLHWRHVEKWLIQFWNPLNHLVKLYDMRFPKFFNKVK